MNFDFEYCSLLNIAILIQSSMYPSKRKPSYFRTTLTFKKNSVQMKAIECFMNFFCVFTINAYLKVYIHMRLFNEVC